MSSPPKIVGISSIKYRYFRLRQQQGMLLGFARLESAYDPGYLEIPIEIEICVVSLRSMPPDRDLRSR
jgi:hypothetical protein